MKKEMLNLNKRTITPLNNVEIAALRGGFNGGIISEKSPGEGYIKGPDGKWYE